MEGGPLTVSRFPPSYEITRVYRVPRPYIVSRPPQPLPLLSRLRQDSSVEIENQHLRERERETNVAITFNGNGSGGGMEIVGRISNLVSDSSIRKENRRVCLCFCSVVCFSPPCFFLLPLFLLLLPFPVGSFHFFFPSFGPWPRWWPRRKKEGEKKNISEIGYKEQTEKESI